MKRSRYFIRFVGNNSKCWDGKEIELQVEWVENLYTKDELKIGNKLNLPWPGKGGSVTNWNAVVVDGSRKKAEKAKKVETGKKREAPSATPRKKKKVESESLARTHSTHTHRHVHTHTLTHSQHIYIKVLQRVA